GHWPFNFLAGPIVAHRQRSEAERSHGRCHQDWDESLVGASNDHVETPGGSFHLDQMLIVGKLKDGIAGADPEYGDETHDGSQGNTNPRCNDGKYAADQAERQICQHQPTIGPPMERYEEDHDD